MKSLKLYGKRDIRFEEALKPTIEEEDEVVIKVKAVGICGSDLSRYLKLGPYIEGMIFGHEFSGEVVEVGSNVENVKVGDRVAGCPALYCGKCESCKKSEYARCDKLTVIGARHPGAYAEYVKLPSENVVVLPENVDYETAALVEPSAVVVHGFYKMDMQPGDEVAVMGCGNIGLLAIQWAKVFGAKKVYAIDIDPKKLDMAKGVGADELINPKEVSAHEQILGLTNGRGVDVAIESAGSPITSAQVLALPKKGGQVVFLGIPYGDVNIERFYFEKVVRNELQVIGAWNAVSAPFPGPEWTTTVHYMSTGQINVKPLITHRLRLEEGPETFESIIERKEFFGKVIFQPEVS
ncbi:galactitol-1-phosphate 5-dehydrogenase [Radiobacillus kanasensis]|uniref:galactitol-1-phosphate 5-dehydrogenase n=1 Tax=Radiobacillus kanasensis TaxID=2844358 RepID=UPI001E283FF6|nr:galactitol-1-phosphate 5-dehydrogenase [Radiobacillus kanasensis]UFT99601.1 galactitol-1-phosphate 5-dehydrogenase [Radiobacillus kanasensis]